MATVAITAMLDLIKNTTLALKGTDCIIGKSKLNAPTMQPRRPLRPSWT